MRATARLFATSDGTEVPSVTAAQMKEVDRIAVEEVGPNLYQMMENAGRNLALTAQEQLGPRWSIAPIAVLAGIGGNGGGGICAARHLANRGMDVTVVVDEQRLSGVPAQQLRVYRGTGGRVARVDNLEELSPELVVDAVIGYGLGGPPRGVPLRMIEWANSAAAPVLSLDVPSGIDSTTGEAPGAHLEAAATLTLALPKTGLVAPAVGDLFLADIGIPAEVYRRLEIDVPASLFGAGYRVALRAR
ncbi:MAG: NAD(P)H-hydrate epimerase [Dehalococcoidia bacterium]